MAKSTAGVLQMNLEEYYKNPIMESWTYVSMGMDNLKAYDLQVYSSIKEKQTLLLPEIEGCLGYIKQVCERMSLNYSQVKFYIEEFMQKFPLALRCNVGWDDRSFIFLYILTRVVKPKVIIETGSNIGFSSSFIALAIKENNNNCKFYTIEPCPEYGWESLSFVEHNNSRKQKINYGKLTGTCEPLGIVPADLKEYIILKRGYGKDILPELLRENEIVDIFFHDSDHGYRNMVWECSTMLPHIEVDGYILVHDIFLNSAFKEMFGKKGGLVIEENLGAYKKTDKDTAIRKEWTSSFDNSRLNDDEYTSKKIKLESSPKNIIIQIPGARNLNCVFCSEGKSNENNSFDNFYQNLEGKLAKYLSQAEKIIFKTCGSFLNASEIRRMIDWRINCIELSFPEIEKIYFTNGIGLTPEVSDFFVNPRGICCREYIVKNTVNLLLYASNSGLYKILTRSDDFEKVLNNILYLIKLKKESRDPKVFLKVSLTFIATTLNIEDLPDFIRLASNMGADQVVCLYSYIYTHTQKYLSCFFKQGETNKILDDAAKLAKELGIEVVLPPKFGQKEYPQTNTCCKPWDEIIIDANGNILSCNSNGGYKENLMNKDFMDIWNGPYYQHLRKNMAEGSPECFKYCYRANPEAVNDFWSHVVLRGKKKSEIDILWGDNF